MKYILAIYLLLFYQALFADMNAVHALEVFKHDADEAYITGHYQNAFNMYRKLATIGDKFAQFRLAVMYAEGLSVDADPVLAYAWSHVAAENDQVQYRQFDSAIEASLDEKELVAAHDLAEDLLSRYGVFANAVAAKKMLDRARRNCTGSRTGSRCDAVTSITLTNDCTANYTSFPSKECLRTGSLGLLSVSGNFPASLNRLETALDIVIETYNPGNVELDELELLNDD